MKYNHKYQPFIRLALACTFLTALAVPALTADLPLGALFGGKFSGQLRYRYEWVDQEGKTRKANALTRRTQLGYLTGSYRGFNAFLQAEDVRIVGSERYNSTVNGLTSYPVVADPAATELNQAYLSYKGLPGAALTYGRQALAYDNQRFVGDVGWRQNQQTFDSLTLAYTAVPNTIMSFARVTNANRIFGEKHPTLSDVQMNAGFLNIAYKGLKPGTVVGYGYLLGYAPAQPFPVTASNKTLGLRFDGATKISGAKLLYTAEYARQSKYKDAAATVAADYANGMLGAEFAGVQVKFNYERLGGDGVYALQTPFATLHAQNGWADKFLVTPKDGLVDRSLSVGAKPGPVSLLGVYRDYSSDYRGYAYGKELNLQASWKAVGQLTLLVKYAAYDGNSAALARNANKDLEKDLDKFWVQADWRF